MTSMNLPLFKDLFKKYLLVPSISTNKQTKTYLILLLICIKPNSGSLMSRAYSPNFWAGYLNPVWADSRFPLELHGSMHSPPMPCTWQEGPGWLLLHAFPHVASSNEVPTPQTSHLGTHVYLSSLEAFLYNLQGEKVTLLKTKDKEKILESV